MLCKMGWLAILLGAGLTAPAYAQRSQSQAQPPQALTSRSSASDPNGRKPFVFQGTVERVNPAGGTVDVKNENLPGWMAPMSMTYRVDNPAVLKTLKPGVHITATVYEGVTSTLYQVRVAALPKQQTENALPPISYVCPSPGEESFIDDKPGRCPKSDAELQPVRLDIAYKCLKTSYIKEKPGACPMDHTDLVPVTASIFWLCKNEPDPEKHHLEPGACRDGSPREKAFEVRPHGDHNPRHGGPSVFMSEDLYHHVEATLVAPTKTQPAIFRVYFYDEYTRPINATGVSAKVAPTDKDGKDTGSPIPLVLSRIKDGNAMEARLSNAPVPSESAPAFFAVRVKLKPTDKDWVTDHTFPSYSKEPARVRSAVANGIAAQNTLQSPSTASAQKRASTSAPARAASAPASATNTPADFGPPVVGEPLPDTRQDLLAELQKNMDSVTQQWQEGSLSGLWYPALRAKDVVLKLQQDHGTDISADKRPQLTSAVQQVMLSAWQIDAAGDLGNKDKIAVLYDVFRTAVGEILGLYGATH
jgi:Cu/Ag efflux protein CusF